MIKDASFGIIPLQVLKKQWHVLLVQQRKGYWAFPKGHAEKKEKPLDSAKRELQEETGLLIQKVLDENPLVEHYSFFEKGVHIDKNVTYFIALVEGELKVQEEEILSAKWVKLNEAEEFLTYKESKDILNKTIEVLSKIKYEKS